MLLQLIVGSSPKWLLTVSIKWMVVCMENEYAFLCALLTLIMFIFMICHTRNNKLYPWLTHVTDLLKSLSFVVDKQIKVSAVNCHDMMDLTNHSTEYFIEITICTVDCPGFTFEIYNLYLLISFIRNNDRKIYLKYVSCRYMS